MFLIDVARWVAYRIIGRPIAWFWLLSCFTLWPAVVVLSPVAIARREDDGSRLAYEVAFVSTLGGVSLALATLGENRWMLCQAGPAKRFGAQSVGLLAGGLIGAASSLLAPLLLGRGLAFDLGLILLATVLTIAHVCGLGLLVLRLPLASSARAMLLPAIAWIVPALIRADEPAGRTLVTLLRADRTLDSLRDANPAGLVSALAPIMVLWLLVAMLEHTQEAKEARAA